MEQAPKTSFIPKQTIGVPRSRERRSFNVVTFASTVIFLAVLVLSIGVFFYKEYVTTNLDTEKQKLADFKEKFDTGASDDMREIRLLEDRFIIAKNLLDRHISMTRVFAALEDRVQSEAQLTSFGYERRPSGEAQLTLDGRALSLNTVALQERGFAAEPSFVPDTIVFSGVDIAGAQGSEDAATSEGQQVVFNIVTDLDTTAVAYRADIQPEENEESAEQATTTESESSATTSPTN